MSTAIVNINQSEIQEKKNLIKRTLCPKATDNDLELFWMVCQRTGLDPFAKQIYPVVRNSKDNGPMMSIQTSIDGYRLIADRTNKYCPGREATYTYDSDDNVLTATSYIKKLTNDGTWHEVAATAHWDEYVQMYDKKPTKFWAQMPHVMLAKCAEALALRKCFPAELSGIYTADEMAQADSETIPTQVVPTYKPAPKAQQIEEKKPVVEIDVVKINADKVMFLTDMINGDEKLRESLIKKCKINTLVEMPENLYQISLDWLRKKLDEKLIQEMSAEDKVSI